MPKNQTGGSSQKSWHSIIYFPTEGTPYAQLKGDSCTETTEVLCATGQSCPADLEFPPVYFPSGNPYLMGYKDRIYEQRSTAPDLTSATEKFIAAWCRSLEANFDQGVDIIIRQEMGTMKSIANIFISERPTVSVGGGKQVLPFEVNRVDGGYSRQYQADAFDLTIDLDIPSGVANKFSGRLRATIDDSAFDKDVLCRIVP